MPITSVAIKDSNADNVSPMATLTIRNLDDAVRDRLRQRAAEHGHSMEEEVRQILRQPVSPPLRPARERRISTEPYAVIAATALAHVRQLATRNIADFHSIGLKLINPCDLDGIQT